MDVNVSSPGAEELHEEESQQTQDYTLDEPVIKKCRYDSGDSWACTPNSDRYTSDGTDSDIGIHFAARSRSGSDEPEKNRPASVVSGGFEPSQNDILVDVLSGSDIKINAAGLNHRISPNFGLETNDGGSHKYELDSDEGSVGSGGFLPIVSENDNFIHQDSMNSITIQKSSENVSSADSVSETIIQVSEESVSTSTISEPQVPVPLGDKNGTETSSEEKTLSSVTEPTSIEPCSAEIKNKCSTTNDSNTKNVSQSDSTYPDSIHGDSQEPGTSSKPNLRKIASLNSDAENIANMLAIDEVDVVYKRLWQLRDQGNRVNLVTNEILEDGFDRLQDKVQKESVGRSECDIFELVEQVKSALEGEKCDVNLDAIFQLLEMAAGKPNQVELVTKLIKESKFEIPTDISSENAEVHPVKVQVAEDIDMFSDVEQVQKEITDADPNEIFTLLEQMADKHANREDVVKSVINTLKSKSNTECPAVESDPDFAAMPLFKELKTISALFPNRDKNEIYAYLEAHYHNTNRVQVVTEELLHQEQGTLTPEADVIQNSLDDLPKPNTNDTQNMIKLQEDVNILQKIFPKCDPDYIYAELESMAGDPIRIQKLSARMFERKDYPQLKDRLEKEKTQEKITKLRNLQLDIEEFLKMFPDPKNTFYDETATVTGNYKMHAMNQLLNDFPMITEAYIKKKLESHGDHYLPTMRDLNQIAEVYRKDRTGAVRSHKRFLYTQRPRDNSMPSVPCELFYREALFCRNEKIILDHIKQIAVAKHERLQQAKDNNELLECTCCYDDEVLLEDMLPCPDGHIFCCECIRRSAESIIGESKSKFPCLDGECELEFSTKVLQSVLPSNLFSVMLRRIQEEEVRRADIADLVGCPFCSFATVMANPDDKVFKCLNPECLKESCRSCKEPNHIPLRCEEVEKESEKNMRAFIEKRMNEAMIRQCYQCKKNFYKVEGCNKMTCVCGAHMCYICREPINGYDHFNRGKCNNYDSNKLHLEEMEKAAKEAREEYERDHPEVKGQDLKHDPSALISKLPPAGQFHRFNDDDDNDSADSEEEFSDDEDRW